MLGCNLRASGIILHFFLLLIFISVLVWKGGKEAQRKSFWLCLCHWQLLGQGGEINEKLINNLQSSLEIP